MFTRFGGLSDARVKAQVARGERLRALLAQPQYSPLRLADEVALAIALGEGLLDRVAAEAIAAVRSGAAGLARSACRRGRREARAGTLYR